MNNAWREHPLLKGRFHPEHPDDVMVLVHDGGPRTTDRVLEEVRVRVSGVDERDVFAGRVLHAPEQLTSVSLNSEIKFVVASKGRPLLVTDRYLEQRPHWRIVPCDQCGLDELLDPPHDLLRTIFPEAPEGSTLETYNTECGLCAGTQIVTSEAAFAGELEDAKKWWQAS